MWLLRRKASVPEVEPELLPPATLPIRRIEITVDRHWVVRSRGLSGQKTDAETSDPNGDIVRFEKPPDG